MTTRRDTSGDNQWLMIVMIVVGLAALGNLITGGANSSAPAPAPAGSPTAEHRYVRERFRQEGYSDREAQQAADAIIKFNNAQQNR